MAKLPSFNTKRAGSISRWSAEVAEKAEAKDIRSVVSRLRLGDLDPKGREHRIGSTKTVRLDRQGNKSGGGAVLHVQLNDAKKLGIQGNVGTTVGQVVVSAEVFEAAADQHSNVQRNLVRVTRSALILSCHSNGRSLEIVLR